VLRATPAFCAEEYIAWRVALIVWIGGSLGIGVTSGMTRFTLPVYPIALAAVFAGVETLRNSNMRFARLVLAQSSLGTWESVWRAFLSIRGRPLRLPRIAIPRGLPSRRAPDYSRTEFLNERLSGARDGGKVLVTFSHTYYLRIPFISGMEQENWFLDPALLPSGADLAQFLRRENIRWVLKEGEYPPASSSNTKSWNRSTFWCLAEAEWPAISPAIGLTKRVRRNR